MQGKEAGPRDPDPHCDLSGGPAQYGGNNGGVRNSSVLSAMVGFIDILCVYLVSFTNIFLPETKQGFSPSPGDSAPVSDVCA